VFAGNPGSENSNETGDCERQSSTCCNTHTQGRPSSSRHVLPHVSQAEAAGRVAAGALQVARPQVGARILHQVAAGGGEGGGGSLTGGTQPPSPTPATPVPPPSPPPPAGYNDVSVQFKYWTFSAK
jgi:hypothetical protein